MAGVIALAHLPMLVLHAQQLWKKPHYQFFPLVLIGSVVLAWNRLQGSHEFKPANKLYCYPAAIFFVLMLFVSAVINSPWLGAVTSLGTILVAIYGIGSWPLTRRLLPAWLLLWLAVPLPNRLDQTLINGLQKFTAQWSSVVLDMLNVLHFMQGNVVEISEKRLLVEEACSGIHSLFATLACTIFFVMWVGRPIIRSILLILSSVFWVVVCNVARVVIVTTVDVYTPVNLTEGLPHEILSLVIFAAILGLVFSTDRLLLFLSPKFLFSKRREEFASTASDETGGIQDIRLPPARQTWLGSGPIVGAYAVLAAIQLIVFWANASEALAIDQLGPDALPETCSPLSKRIDYVFNARDQDHFNEGDYSQIWTYRIGENQAVVSLDYPFVGWHELTVCYGASGWNVSETKEHEDVSEDGTLVDGYKEAFLNKPPKNYGYLIFGVYDPTGRPLKPVQEEFWRRVGRGMGAFRRLLGSWGSEFVPVDKLPGPSYQVQLFIRSSKPLTDAEKKEALVVFQKARSELSAKISKEREGK